MAEWKPKSAREVTDGEWRPKSGKPVEPHFSPPSFVRGQREADQMGDVQRFFTGMGGGAVNMAKNVGDVLTEGFDPRTPGVSWMKPDPQKWAEERAAQRYVTDSNVGEVGNFVGENAPLAAFGVGVGSALRAGLAKAAPVAIKAPGLVGKLVRALPRAVEGYYTGRAAGGPEHRNLGGGLGAAANVALPPLFSAGGRIMWRGLVNAGEAAQALHKAGVTKQTIGQMSPRSMVSQFEEAGTSSGAGGNILKAMRQEPVEQYQGVVLKKAPAPGSGPLPEGTVSERLRAAYESYDPAYGAIKEAPIPADMGGVSMRQAMGEAFDAVANNPDILADEIQRGAVNKFLQNKATVLDKVPVTPWPQSPRLPPGAAPGGPLGLPANASPSNPEALALALPDALARRGIVIPPKPVIPGMRGSIPAGAVMKVREGIRGQAAKTLASEDYTSAELLGGAEDVLTDALDTHLPKDGARKLRATDAAYAKYKTVADAVGRARDAPDGFRPTHLEAAVKAAAPTDDAYARGWGGELRDLSRHGREVFDQRVPLTGARALTAGPGHWVTTPTAVAANALFNSSPTVKNAMLGNLPLQRALTAAEAKLLRQESLARALRMTAAKELAADPIQSRLTDMTNWWDGLTGSKQKKP